jgi:hypothetical protein
MYDICKFVSIFTPSLGKLWDDSDFPEENCIGDSTEEAAQMTGGCETHHHYLTIDCFRQ